MKNQALFSTKDKSKKLKCPLLQLLFGALMVKMPKVKKVECANSVAPDEITHDELLHLSLQCLPSRL